MHAQRHFGMVVVVADRKRGLANLGRNGFRQDRPTPRRQARFPHPALKEQDVDHDSCSMRSHCARVAHRADHRLLLAR